MKIPTIVSGANVGASFFAGGANPSAASSIASGAQGLSAGIANVGEGLLSISQRKNVAEQKLKQKQEYDDVLWAESQYTEAQRSWLQWTDDVQKSGEENVIGRFNTDYDKFQTEALKSAPNDQARDRLKMKLDDLGTRIFDTSLKIQATNQAKNTVNTFNQMLTSSSDTIARVPELYQVEQERLTWLLNTAKDRGRINEETFQRGMAQVNELAADASESLVATNPDAAEHILKEAEGIPWTRRKSITNQITQSRATNDTLGKYNQDELLQANVASISQTGIPAEGFDVESYASAFPKEQQTTRKVAAERQIAVAENLYVGKSAMLGKPPGQVAQELASRKPEPGSKTYDTDLQVYQELSKVAEAQVKLFRTDPFAFSRQDPVVDKSWDMVEDLPENADVSVRKMVYEQALDASVNFQRSSGVPEDRVTVISQDQAGQLASQINSGSPEQIQQSFGQLMSTYGKYYPQAFRTLVTLPEGRRIDASTQIAALHYGKPFLGDFLQAIKVPDSDYKLESADRKLLKERVPTNENFMAFAASMTSANPRSVSTVNDFGTAIEKYATSLVARGKASPKDAINQATDLIIGSAYGFATVNDTPVAIKRIQGNVQLNDRDIEDVQHWLMFAPRTIDPKSIDTSRFGFPANLSQEVITKSVADTLRGDSFWVTNPANDGASLYINGMEGTTAPLRTKDGKQIEVKFIDAMTNWRQELSSRINKSGGFSPAGL